MGAVGNYEVIEQPFSISFSNPFGESKTLVVEAPAGKVVFGGNLQLTSSGVTVSLTRPAPDGTSWQFVLRRGSTGSATGTAFVTVAQMGGCTDVVADDPTPITA